jgi:SNF2 family DNA or RNA helicase
MSDAAIYRLLSSLQGVTSGFRMKLGKHITREPMFPNPADNPRIEALLYELDAVPPEDKVLIFCTYTREIEDVAACINARWPGQAVTFYGEVPQKVRQSRIDAFREDKRFLVANKSCGAFGLNLQFCHRVVFYSHDWNWGTRAQAEDRVHRFGQTHDVEITDIVARESIDGSILACLTRKETLSDAFKREMEQQSGKNFLRGGPNGKNLSEAKRIRGRAGTA